MDESEEISDQHQKEQCGDTTRNFDDISDHSNYDAEQQEEKRFDNLKRYSRYDLLSLRNKQFSIHHPECALRPDLQALSIWTCRLRCELQYSGLWKVPNTGNQYGNCGSNASCCQSYACADSQSFASTGSGNAGANNGCYANVQQPQIISGSSPTLVNKRAVRSRERFLNHQRCINTELVTATSPGEVSLHHSNHHNIKTSFIDQRSISSSHLMPAFAKRRMGNVNSSQQSSSESSSLSNNNGSTADHLINEGSDDGEDDNHFETSLKSRKDVLKSGISQNDHYNYKTSTHNSRMDKSDQIMDHQSGWINLVQNINSDHSPCNNNKNNAGGANKKMMYERRIGSGRLVPRDVNWDMRAGNGKQVEKNTAAATTTGEKDYIVGGAEKLNQRNTSTRYSDPRTQERRLYDRRISNSDDTNREKHELNMNSSSNKRHSTNSGDERNNIDGSNFNQHQQTQHFMGQRSMSFRRREYGEQRGDNQDYRDFREQKDLREHRDIRKQKFHKDEPEWFSEGPTSQHDTIELRGFEEHDDTELDVKYSTKTERKNSESSLSHASSNVNLSANENQDVSNEVLGNISKNILSTKEGNDNSCIGNDKQNKDLTDDDDDVVKDANISNPDESKTGNVEKFGSNVTELFFDNFLNMDALESSIISGQDQTIDANKSGGTSRFSRWFFNNSNKNNVGSKEEFDRPIKDEPKPNKDINESNYSETNSLRAFLKCNNFPTPELPKSLPVNVLALSVEELEARMRKMDTSDRTILENADCASQQPDIPSQDVEAFRKLLDQLGKPQVDISMNIILPQTGHPIPLPTSMGVLPPGIVNHNLPQSNLLKQEYMLKMMHQQQQLIHHPQNLMKVVPPPQHHRMTQLSPPQQQMVGRTENMPLMPVPHNPHLTSMVISHPQKRLDVQHLIQSVAREELSRSFLEIELRNPNIPPYAKDIISTVLKETSRCVKPSLTSNLNTLSAAGPSTTDSNSPQHPTVTDNAAPQNLMQSLARGEVSLNHLEHALNKLNNPSVIHDPSTVTFKEGSRCVTPSAMSTTGMIVPLPPQVTSNDNVGTMSSEQHAISMLRSHHDDPSMHVPTQRELQIHTQAIMQNALFKKKLEVEQHEAIRRRQDIHKQLEIDASNQQQPQHNSGIPQQIQLPSRHMNSPTPLAFTPTSVLRKMTAEKDNNCQQATMTLTTPQQQQQQPPLLTHVKLTPQQIHNQPLSYQHANQPRMIVGGGNHHHMHHQQHQVTSSANGSPQISPQQKAQIRNQPPAPLKWSTVPHSSMNSSHPLLNAINKPMGRPILKGPIPTLTQQSQNQQYSSQSNQIQNSPQTITQMHKYPTQHQPRQIVGQQFPTHLLQHHNMQHQQLFLQQQRSTAMHRQHIQQTDVGTHAPAIHHPPNDDNNSITNINYQRDGGLSPTSNQLAQWFSPELLAQASAGKLPLLNMNQALSLEEFERSIQNSSTTVHN